MATGTWRDGGREELNLSDYIAVLRRRLAWVLLPLAVLPALAALRSMNAPERYQAESVVMVKESLAQEAIVGSDDAWSSEYNLENDLRLATSDQAWLAAQEKVGPDGFVLSPSVAAGDWADTVTFVITAGSAEDAAFQADLWAETFVDLKRSEANDSVAEAIARFEATLVSNQAQRDEAVATGGDPTLYDAQIDNAIYSLTSLEIAQQLNADGTARVIRSAGQDVVAVNSPLIRDLVLALVVALLLGAGAALLVDNLDQTLRRRSQLERLGLAVLATVPKPSKAERRGITLASLRAPGLGIAEAYQQARLGIDSLIDGKKHGNAAVVLVTSAMPGEGKTTTAANLSLAYASSGLKTVLIDADLRRPRIHTTFGVKREPGMSGLVRDKLGLHQAGFEVAGIGLGGSLLVLPAGPQPPDAAQFLSTRAFSLFLEELAATVDVIVLDAPPTLPVADASALAPLADEIVLVAFEGSTKTSQIKESQELLVAAGGTVAGVVLVGSSEATTGSLEARKPERQPHSMRGKTPKQAPTRSIIDLRQPATGTPHPTDNLPIGSSRIMSRIDPRAGD